MGHPNWSSNSTVKIPTSANRFSIDNFLNDPNSTVKYFKISLVVYRVGQDGTIISFNYDDHIIKDKLCFFSRIIHPSMKKQ